MSVDAARAARAARALLCLLGPAAWALDQAGVTPAAAGSEEWAFQRAGAGQCKILFTSSYGYRQFFPVGDAASRSDGDPMAGYPAPLPPRPATQQPGAPDALLKGQRLLLRFQVMADSDAHILMSGQRRSDREAYEVVLGAGANTYSDFRRLPASIPPKRAFNYSTGVVSGTELRAFWLLADLRSGVLAVGREGGPPILSWVDPDPIQVRYFSLCTWTDVHGTWLYGCSEAGSSEALDSEELSPAERVLQHIVSPHKRSAPRNTTAVTAHLTLDRDRFLMDDRQGVLSLFGTLVVEWRDDRLVWSPANFTGLNSTVVAVSDVWSPDLRIVDPVQLAQLAPPRSHLQMDSSGKVQSRSQVVLQLRCALGGGSGGGESYNCGLSLTAPPPAHLTLVAAAGKQRANQVISDWQWVGVESAGDSSDLLQLSVRLRHRGSRLSCVFLAAFTAACVCCSLSLLSPMGPLGPRTPRTPLLAALTLLMTAVSLISLHLALPPAVRSTAPVSVTCLALALALAAGALVVPVSVAALQDTRLPSRLPRLPRPLRSPALSRLLFCWPEAEKRPRWREATGTPEQALEMFKEWEIEETSKDWQVLSVVVEKACTVICLILTLAAIATNLVQTK